MLTSHANNNGAYAFPIGNISRFNFSQGLSYNPVSSTTNVTTLGITSPVTSGTASNLTTSSWLPNKLWGSVFLNNTTGSNPGLGKTIRINTATAPVSFTMIIAFELAGINAFFNSDIIIGAYASSTHDWWFGMSSSVFIFSKNGASVSSGITGVVGRRYIGIINNNPLLTTANYFYLFDSAGNSYSNTSMSYANVSTAGIAAIGKYGDFSDTYLPNIYVKDYFYGSGTLSSTTALAIKNSIKWEVGISV